jgi:hypothetical protein
MPPQLVAGEAAVPAAPVRAPEEALLALLGAAFRQAAEGLAEGEEQAVCPHLEADQEGDRGAAVAVSGLMQGRP